MKYISIVRQTQEFNRIGYGKLDSVYYLKIGLEILRYGKLKQFWRELREEWGLNISKILY